MELASGESKRLSTFCVMAVGNALRFLNLRHAELKNSATGTLVSGKKTRVNIGSPKSVSKDPIIVEGTHEAIITKEEFEQANSKIVRINKKPKNDLEYPLKWLVKCGDCRRAMRRKARDVMNTYYVCGNRAKDSTSNCRTRKVDEKRIEELAYNAILKLIELRNAKLDNKPAKELRMA